MDKNNTYTWYDPNSSSNGGAAGTQNGGTCSGALACDTASYAQAINVMKLCGVADWRVPSVNELLSIAHYGINPGLAVDRNYFPDQVEQLWSANYHPYSVSTAWSVSFKWGSRAAPSDKAKAIPVRLVSGKTEVSRNARFVDNMDGTVTDIQTGLMWLRCWWGSMWNGQSCVERNPANLGCGGDGWMRALYFAACLNPNGGFAGYQDWRVPNIKELASIVDWESEQHFSSILFPNIPPYEPFWSSSTDVYTTGGVWVIETSTAEIRSIGRTSSGIGVLVRGGP